MPDSKQAQAPKKTKVLHLCDKLAVDEGVAGIARSLSLELPRYSARFKPVVYTLRAEDPGCRLLKSRGILVNPIGKNKFDPSALFDLLRIMKQERADLIHTHGFAASNFGRVASWLTGTPVVVEENFCYRIPVYQRIADCLLCGLATKAVAISEATKAFMVHKRFFDARRVDVVYRGIALDNGSAVSGRPSEALTLRASYAVAPDHKVVSLVGRLHPVKGQEILLRAIPEVLRRFSRVTFLLVGEGAQRARLEGLAEELGVKANVRFVGFVDNVDSVFEMTDILVVPSLSEAFGRAAIEGMFYGCALIVSRVEGLAEICSEGQDALFIAPGDAHDLAKKLAMLLIDESLRLRLAGRARESAKRFSVDETVRKFERIYEEILP